MLAFATNTVRNARSNKLDCTENNRYHRNFWEKKKFKMRYHMMGFNHSQGTHEQGVQSDQKIWKHS